MHKYKVGQMVIVIKSELGNEGAIGTILSLRAEVDKPFYKVKFPRLVSGFSPIAGRRVILPSEKLWYMETWVSPVSGLPESDSITTQEPTAVRHSTDMTDKATQ